MKVVVTGGAGFIGSHLVDKLIGGNHDVLVVDDLSSGKRENINSRADFLQLDIEDKKFKQFLVRFKPEIVYHLAAQKNVRTSLVDPIQDAQINIIAGLRILQTLKKDLPNTKVVFASTAGVYGEPRSLPMTEDHPIQLQHPYGLTKFAFENYLRILDINHVCVRPANVYGPRQDAGGEGGVVSIFIDHILHDKKLSINGDGQQTRDFIYVEDVVDGFIAASSSERDVFNLSTSRQTSILKLVQDLTTVSQKKILVEHGQSLQGDVMASCLDNTKAKQKLNWQPKYDLIQGLEKTWQWAINK